MSGCARSCCIEQEIPLAIKSEMLLYMASRAQLVAEVIQPNLLSGQVVISDRYLLANVVYQGCAGGEDIEQILAGRPYCHQWPVASFDMHP